MGSFKIRLERFEMIAKYVRGGCDLPRFYAVGRIDVYGRGAWCYPIPLHFLVRWSIGLWYWVHRVGNTWWEEKEREIEGRLWLTVVKPRLEQLDRIQALTKEEFQRSLDLNITLERRIRDLSDTGGNCR